MWISTAYAQDAAAGTGGFDLVGLLPLVLIFVVFYFLLIRPQQKKMKQHRAMVSALKRGDRVVSAGGIIGEVTKVVSDTEVQVEIAEGVRVRMQRTAISDLLTRAAPANDEAEPAKGS
jgi:preprotein translocase subunit YajC